MLIIACLLQSCHICYNDREWNIELQTCSLGQDDVVCLSQIQSSDYRPSLNLNLNYSEFTFRSRPTKIKDTFNLSL